MKIIQSRTERILLSLPEKFPGVEIDYHVFMPDHVHMSFHFQRADAGLGEVVGVFKAMVSRKRPNQVPGHPVWQRNFYEYVVRSEEALLRIREYIVSNPIE